MDSYQHRELEAKWQTKWKNDGLYRTQLDEGKPKSYVLDMFPYPSGEGLHVGHPKGYIATDIYSRMKRMQGHNVLHPMGWDAFGLPAEQFALKNKVHPRVAVEKNIARFKEQLAKIGFNYDWEREVNTTDPEFYKWTQWIFKQLFKQGLAYESYEPINWCPSCKTGLSNEDLDGDLCERCGTKVEKKPLRQWILKITAYADRMLEDLDKLNWPESIKESQRNWIGKSEGATIDFAISGTPLANISKVSVFTTRPDTLFGATFVAISHELAQKWIDAGWNTTPEIKAIIEQLKKEEESRDFKDKEVATKLGIATGISVINPATGETIPVWIANYVLSGYGTGALMAVPAHDDRDHDFAQIYQIPVTQVIKPKADVSLPYCDIAEGDMLINSGAFDGQDPVIAKKLITEHVGGELTATYKLKEWVFARQRYWGEPFPIVFDEAHRAYAVADSELPVRLPEVEAYEPTGTGESPLANITEWVEVWGQLNEHNEFETLPKDDPRGKLFRRETNTMPQWAGSSWYYLRYIDPKNSDALINKSLEKNWSPVDFYVGGAEHATRHLIYARFWHKFLFDIGVVNFDEPFMRLQNVGLIQAEDGRKMSKRWGNVINPDDMVERFGADTLRMYEMFMGPFDQAIAWSTESMMGTRRFLERVWKMQDRIHGSAKLTRTSETLLHQTIKKVGDDIERFGFNTAISSMMILLNALEKEDSISTHTWEVFLCLLAPFAPHITEELWQRIGHDTSIHTATWPVYDDKKLVSDSATIAVQVNGKLRDTVEADRGISESDLMNILHERPQFMKWLDGKTVAKSIYIQDKLLNIVVKEG